ncbi:catecholate siderophore receptor Fiu [Oleiagrimonas citrea]|uniref:Catecholate siderophore receptor Fiu n=1 Tax=Oleiagrimonas citrea TaxID=1665687 RepID=A0A846ZJJ4_9GAMM|nr:catecholate siderophore receptor Fiu [Oleiagrimonas citrea]NKZ37972.1 catecholate siderophore receptor Fiu [Oleiagrimonas citrea]
MAAIKSRKHARSQFHPAAPRNTPNSMTCMLGALALGLPTLSVGAHAATPKKTHADDAAAIAQAKKLPGVSVRASLLPDYLVDKSASDKYTQPLVDTTQTLQVISSDLFNQQGATTLTDVLRNSPGVGTFYVGENGSTQTGDAIYMRGFDSSGSIFVDGVRDLGAISRDVFNIDQVEVLKGPAGADNGRTAPTGAINMITKQPMAANATAASLSYGSGDRKRATVDWNRQTGEHSAFRLNLMGQRSGVPGRDRVENNRWGFAPSLAFGLDTPTRVYIDYLHVKQDNVPDGGVSTIGLPGYSSPDPARPELANAPKVDPSNFYGTTADHDDVRADMFTVRVEHDFGDRATLRNTTRWGRTRQDYLLSSFMSRAEYLDTPDLAAPSTWTMRRLPNFRHQENAIATNQTHLTWTLHTGAVEHDFSAGIEFTREELSTVALGALGDGSWPAVGVYDPSPYVGTLDYGETGGWSKGRTDTVSAYLFDTMKFGPRWQLNLGARLDHYTTDFHSVAPCGGRRGPDCGGLADGTPTTELDTRLQGNLPNWKVGLLYKPAENGSVYANVAVSQQPPGGDTLALSSRPNNAANPDFDPQKAHTVELGTKWNLIDDRLLLTAAVYRTVVTNQVEQDPVDLQYVQTGRKRVQGVELSAVGKLTENWAISAGFTTMDATVTRGDAVANDGSDDLAYTPTRAFTAWTTYHLPFNLTLGGGARYAGALKRGHDGAVGTPEFTRSYWVFDAVASYPLNRHTDLRLNVNNLLDKHYVAAINKSGYRYTPGTPRAAMLTVNVRF